MSAVKSVFRRVVALASPMALACVSVSATASGAFGGEGRAQWARPSRAAVAPFSEGIPGRGFTKKPGAAK